MVAEQDGVGIYMELPASISRPEPNREVPKHGPDPPPDEEVIGSEPGEGASVNPPPTPEAPEPSEMEPPAPAESVVPETPAK